MLRPFGPGTADPGASVANARGRQSLAHRTRDEKHPLGRNPERASDILEVLAHVIGGAELALGGAIDLDDGCLVLEQGVDKAVEAGMQVAYVFWHDRSPRRLQTRGVQAQSAPGECLLSRISALKTLQIGAGDSLDERKNVGGTHFDEQIGGEHGVFPFLLDGHERELAFRVPCAAGRILYGYDSVFPFRRHRCNARPGGRNGIRPWRETAHVAVLRRSARRHDNYAGMHQNCAAWQPAHLG